VASQGGCLLAIIVDSDGGKKESAIYMRAKTDICSLQIRVYYFSSNFYSFGAALSKSQIYTRVCVAYCSLNSDVPCSVRREALEGFYLDKITSYKRFLFRGKT
jgi:hypothetical protein